MKLSLHRKSLQLKHPFTIARGTITEQISLIVACEHAGHVGLGEVTENSYYGHSYATMAAAVDRAREHLPSWIAAEPGTAWSHMLEVVEGNTFAASALDMALLDLQGKLQGKPVWQMWGLEWNESIHSSFTIGIDSIDKMLAKLAEEPGWPTYKIKLGTAHDVEIMRELRQATTAIFRVDANCGWTADEAIAKSMALAELGVEFIEQPLAPDCSFDDHQRVFRQSALPIMADESCQHVSDVTRCAELFHGINVKLCKCGGLSPALSMLRDARQRGMRTMVGCMIESSVGISGSAQLLPLLDFADLDGATLIDNDPATGVQIDRGSVLDYQRPGTGAMLRTTTE